LARILRILVPVGEDVCSVLRHPEASCLLKKTRSCLKIKLFRPQLIFHLNVQQVCSHLYYVLALSFAFPLICFCYLS
jgi:hypothetical protein